MSVIDEAKAKIKGRGLKLVMPEGDDARIRAAADIFRREGLAEAAAKSALRSMGTTVGREIIRGVLGSLLGGSGSKRRR